MYLFYYIIIPFISYAILYFMHFIFSAIIIISYTPYLIPYTIRYIEIILSSFGTHSRSDQVLAKLAIATDRLCQDSTANKSRFLKVCMCVQCTTSYSI